MQGSISQMERSPSQLARELLQQLQAPVGTVNVIFEKGDGGKLVVLIAPGLHLKRERMPAVFHGLPVSYSLRRPGKPFAL